MSKIAIDIFGKIYNKISCKLAGKTFKVFEDDTTDIIVPYGKGEELIAQLLSCKAPAAEYLLAWERQAKNFSIGIYDYQLKALGGSVKEYHGIKVLSDRYYDKEIGLTLNPTELEYLEV